MPEKAYYSLLTEFPRRAAMDQSDASSMENFFPSADPHEKDFPPFYYYFLSHFMTRSLLLNIRNCWVSSTFISGKTSTMLWPLLSPVTSFDQSNFLEWKKQLEMARRAASRKLR